MRSISAKVWRSRWREPSGRDDAGQREIHALARERRLLGRRLRRPAASSSSRCSTCARSSFRQLADGGRSAGGAVLSQFSVMRVSTPDLRPSHASRSSFQRRFVRGTAASAVELLAHLVEHGARRPRRRRRPARPASWLSDRSPWNGREAYARLRAASGAASASAALACAAICANARGILARPGRRAPCDRSRRRRP